MFREILPNMASIVMGTLLACIIYGIGAQAGLEFLGLGDVSTVSWGNNLYWAGNEGALLTGSWWVFVPSGVCIALVAFSLALINYAVDEVTNPRLQEDQETPSLSPPESERGMTVSQISFGSHEPVLDDQGPHREVPSATPAPPPPSTASPSASAPARSSAWPANPAAASPPSPTRSCGC